MFGEAFDPRVIDRACKVKNYQCKIFCGWPCLIFKVADDSARGLSAATQSLKKCPVDKVFELLMCLYRKVSAWATVMCQNVSNRRAEKDMAFVILVM